MGVDAPRIATGPLPRAPEAYEEPCERNRALAPRVMDISRRVREPVGTELRGAIALEDARSARTGRARAQAFEFGDAAAWGALSAGMLASANVGPRVGDANLCPPFCELLDGLAGV